MEVAADEGDEGDESAEAGDGKDGKDGAASPGETKSQSVLITMMLVLILAVAEFVLRAPTSL